MSLLKKDDSNRLRKMESWPSAMVKVEQGRWFSRIGRQTGKNEITNQCTDLVYRRGVIKQIISEEVKLLSQRLEVKLLSQRLCTAITNCGLL